MDRRTDMAARVAGTVFAMLAVAAVARAAEGGAPSDRKWGALTVRTTATGENAGPNDRAHLQFLDASGRVLTDLSDAMVAGTTVREIDGRGLPEIEVNMFSGGAHCCFTNTVFTQDGGFHRLLDLPGGQIEGIAGLKDLNRDGRPEIIIYDNNTWAYYGGLAFAVSPNMPLIIGWNGSRYVNQTRKFPQRTLEAAKNFQANLLADLRMPRKDDRPEWREDRRHAAALGYFSNMLAVGKGAEAKAWLGRHAPLETRKWLAGHETAIRSTIKRWLKEDYTPKR